MTASGRQAMRALPLPGMAYDRAVPKPGQTAAPPVRLPAAGGHAQTARWASRLALGLLAVVIGLGSAALVLRSVSSFGEAAGPWRVSTLAGSTDADLYTRARVALGGLLALNRSETMYYVASTDSTGQPLRSRCAYRVSGMPPAARWWSVTAYADDFFLFVNEQRRYSLNGASARLDAQGRFAFISAPVAPADTSVPWLPTPGDRGLLFALRVYNPAPTLQAAPAALPAPLIEAVADCR